MLGRSSRDIDLVVAGDAVEIARDVARDMQARFVLLDQTHQVARVVLLHAEHRWYIDFTTMRGSIEQDLEQRDFTIDAMALPLEPFEQGINKVRFIDPLNGIIDLEAKSVKAVNDYIFLEDPLRLLRAIRLAAELNFEIDNVTEDLIARDNGNIMTVSAERIREEIARILQTGNAARSILLMDHSGLLDQIIPELTVCKEVEQPKEHFWNVFDHSMETVAAVERLLLALTQKGDLLDSLTYAPDLADRFNEKVGGGLNRQALIKLAALLHDVAKPQTKAIHENGRMRFLGHAQQGAAIAENILERLRFGTREKSIVCMIIDQHLRPGHLSNASELPTQRAIYRYFRDTSDVGIDTLFLSLADHLATRGPTFEMEGWLRHVEVTQYMLNKWYEEKKIVSPPRLVDGNVLIEKFNLKPGPEIGRLIESVREAQASGEVVSRDEALDFVRKELSSNHAAQR